jgi:Condensation domain
MHPSVTRKTSAAMAGRELTLGQEALWFLQQLAPGSSAYNVSGAMNLHFPADGTLLTSAVGRTISRHSVLNCVFRSAGGEIRRFFRGDTGDDPVLEMYEPAGDDEAVRAFAQELADRPFRLDRQRPIRVALLRRANGPDILLMAAHHIVVDNVSQQLIFREIIAEYVALAAGTEPAAGDTGADFDDFAGRQREFLASARAAAARAYWQGELAGVAETGCLPADRPRPALYEFVGSEIDFEFPADVSGSIGAAASAHNTTVFNYLLSTFQLLLYRFSGHTDFVIGYPASLRPGRRFRESIGYFVNTLPFRARIDPDGSFEGLIRRTGDKLWSGLMYRDYPFALMPQLAGMPRRPDRAGLISVMFVMTPVDPADRLSVTLVQGDRVEHAGLIVSEYYLPQQQGQFDMTLQVLHRGAGTRAQLKYNTSLFTAETARRLAGDYVELLRSAAGGTIPPRLRDVAGHSGANGMPEDESESRTE